MCIRYCSTGNGARLLVLCRPAGCTHRLESGGVLIIFFVPSHGILGWAASVYAPILLLLRLSSVEEPVRLRFSVLLVIVSDLLLMVFYLFVEDPVLHAGCMFLFYLSLLLITVDCSPGKAAAEAPKEAENAAA